MAKQIPLVEKYKIFFHLLIISFNTCIKSNTSHIFITYNSSNTNIAHIAYNIHKFTYV